MSHVPDDPPDDDGALFRAAIGPLRPLPPRTPDARDAARTRPLPRAVMAERDEAEARDEFRQAMTTGLDAADVISYRRDEVPARVLARLRRGHYAAQDEVDLHGCREAQAESLLRSFLAEARDEGRGCVRIVHGKGLRAADGMPVLKNLVDRLLRQRSDVLAFHSALGGQGGTGAVLVLLRPARRR